MMEKNLKEVKQLIRSILLSNPQGLTFRQLNIDYNALCGKKVPYREFGYANILEFIEDIPDVVMIHTRPCYEMILKGVDDESIKNRENKRLEYHSDYSEINKGVLSLNISSRGINNKLVIPEMLKNQLIVLVRSYKYGILIDEIEHEFFSIFGKDLRTLYKNLGFSTLEEFLKQIDNIKLTYSVCLSKKCFVTLSDSSAKKSKNLKESNQILQVRREISDTLKEEFRRMLNYYPDGIRSSQFLEKFNKISRRNLSLTELGYQNVQELALAYPNIFVIRSLNNCKDDCLFFSLDNFKNSMLLKSISKYGSDDNVAQNVSGKNDERYERMKNNVKDILRTFSRTILLQKFEQLYKFCYQFELPWKSLGYENVETFLLDLSAEIPFKIFNIGNKLYMSLETEEIKHIDDFSNMKFPLIPSDSVVPGTPHVYQELPEDLSKYISVYVSEVEHPGRIWLQIKNKKSKQSLDALRKELEKTYRSEKRNNLRYKMPNSFISLGTICAAIWPVDNNWYRGIITDILQDNRVEIFYADYGNHSAISKFSLMILKKEFLGLPFQALKARLANIKPANGTKWDRKSQLRLHEMCINKYLVALITDTKFKESLSVYLCDISEEGYLHINETLIKEGLAEFSPDPRNSSLEFVNSLKAMYLNQHIKPMTTDIQDFGIFFKRIYLNANKEIHIISFNQKYYVSNKDLIFLFQKSINLENELMARKLLIPHVVIRKASNEQLFEKLNKIDSKETKYTSDYLVLYPLEYLPEMFNGLRYSFPKEMKKKIEMLCLSYQTMSLKEIRENIQKRYNEKHKILKQMTENQSRDDYVENLKYIDENLKLLWLRMKELKDDDDNEIVDLMENQSKPLTKLVSKITQCYKKH